MCIRITTLIKTKKRVIFDNNIIYAYTLILKIAIEANPIEKLKSFVPSVNCCLSIFYLKKQLIVIDEIMSFTNEELKNNLYK